MKKHGIFWGITLIITAIFVLVNSIGLPLGVVGTIPVINIILGILCVAWFIYLIAWRKFSLLFIPPAVFFMVFESQIGKLLGKPDDFISNWLVVLCTVLLTIGLTLILPHRKVKIKGEWSGKKNGNCIKNPSFTKYIDSATFHTENVENNMGSCHIYFDNADLYAGDGMLIIENNMGYMGIHIPASWHIETDIDNNLGKIETPSTGAQDGKTITVRGDNNLGKIEILLV